VYGWNLVWSSSDIDVASVDQNGYASFNSAGSASIKLDWDETFYWDDGEFCYSTDWSYNVSAQATACVPASLRIVQDITDYPNGNDLYDRCSNLIEESGSFWGIERCIQFQLVDSCGNDVTGGNYLASEYRTPYAMNPAGQQVQSNSAPLTQGGFDDFMDYVTDVPPGPP
jgi:hypothetical protein